MDEHKNGAVTEFLKREIRAWEEIWKTEGRQKRLRVKRPKRWLLAVFAVTSMLLLIGVSVWLIPWKTLIPPICADGGDLGSTEGAEHSTQPGTEQPGETQVETQEQESLPQPSVDLYAYDFSAVPAGATPIVPQNIATKNHPINQTDRVIDMQSVLEATCSIPAPQGQISVLILHTHTGEGYNRDGALYLDSSDEEFARSADGSDGVVAVGAGIAKRLNEAGIGTIHCKTVFDGESNREAYARAAEAIEAFRLAYPSLVCVIDVHRDAATDAQGNIVRTLAVRDGQGIAQTRLICGMSAERTSKTNLALAIKLCERMNQAFPDSCASVICKAQTLNQDCAPFSLTLEIGSCGNTPDEAQAAAEIVAQALCELFETG